MTAKGSMAKLSPQRLHRMSSCSFRFRFLGGCTECHSQYLGLYWYGGVLCPHLHHFRSGLVQTCRERRRSMPFDCLHESREPVLRAAMMPSPTRADPGNRESPHRLSNCPNVVFLSPQFHARHLVKFFRTRKANPGLLIGIQSDGPSLMGIVSSSFEIVKRASSSIEATFSMQYLTLHATSQGQVSCSPEASGCKEGASLTCNEASG